MPSSVPVFDIPVPIRVYGQDHDTTFVLSPDANGNVWFSEFVPYQIDSVAIDPDLWILSGQNHVIHIIDAVHTPTVQLGLRVSPNPVRGMLRVQGAQLPGEGHLVVTDVLGRPVFDRSVAAQSAAWQEKIDLGQLPAGLYFLQIQGADWRSELVRVVK